MFGLITGSGFYDIADLDSRSTQTVDGPYGKAVVTTGSWRGRPIVFLPRHGPDHSVPPAAINYRANIWALRQAGATSILATAVSGGIDPAMMPGMFVAISDYLNFTSGRADTFFDGTVEPFDASEHHTDMTRPYDPALRGLLVRAATDQAVPLVDKGVYCATNGPRFETPAEIEMMRRAGGQLVGMTGYPEVALAAEAGIPYASIGIIANPAAGLGLDQLAADDMFELIEGAAEPLHRLIEATMALATDGTA